MFLYWVCCDRVHFLHSSLVWCCRLVIKTVLVTDQCFSYCWASRPSLFPTASLKASRLELGKKLGTDLARKVDPSWPKGYPIPHVVVLSNKILGKEGRKRKWGTFIVRTHSLKALLSRGWLDTCWWEAVNMEFLPYSRVRASQWPGGAWLPSRANPQSSFVTTQTKSAASSLLGGNVFIQ